MRIPTIHLNGTSGTELIDQNLEAYEAIRSAVSSVERAAPNARDFYVQGENAYREAVAEHAARVKALLAVAEAYERIVEVLNDPTAH